MKYCDDLPREAARIDATDISRDADKKINYSAASLIGKGIDSAKNSEGTTFSTHKLKNNFVAVLASSSPRRRKLLSEIISNFVVILPNFDEDSVQFLSPRQLVRQISFAKAKAVLDELSNKDKILGSLDNLSNKDNSVDSLGKLCDGVNSAAKVNVPNDVCSVCGVINDSTLADKVIISADTIVYRRKVYGKPIDANDALQMLSELNGKWHSVYTGVCVLILPHTKRDKLHDVKQSNKALNKTSIATMNKTSNITAKTTSNKVPNEKQAMRTQEIKFVCRSRVKFKKLTEVELKNYVNAAHPLDKSGSYGIQDGVVVEKYKGSLSNIIGLPTEKLIAILTEAGVIVNEHH